MTQLQSGIIIINKPSGISSAGAVAAVKRALNTPKVGHMGTLDPLASGVLIVGVGRATKLFDMFLGHDKTYIAEFSFGLDTDTLDITGNIVGKSDRIPTVAEIQAVLPLLQGDISQLPPQFSAKKVGGVRAYQLARQGKSAELSPKDITIYSMEHIGQSDDFTHKFAIRCSSGTYIRAIGRDMAASLGTVATMMSLVRTVSGEYSIDDSVAIDNITSASMIPLGTVLKGYATVCLADEYFDRLSNGVRLGVDACGQASSDSTSIVIYCRDRLFGIYNIIDGQLVQSAWLY